jgi:hypothetical protein
MRADGRIRVTGENGKPYPGGLEHSLHGSGLCRFTLEEVRKWRPDLSLRDDELLFS